MGQWALREHQTERRGQRKKKIITLIYMSVLLGIPVVICVTKVPKIHVCKYTCKLIVTNLALSKK